jgi:hypothetical protein
MTFRTGQFFTSRVFSVEIDPSTDPADLARSVTLATDALRTLVDEWVKVANADHLAQTGSPIDLQYSLPLSEIVDGKIRIASDVVMDAWPEDLLFGQSVWDYFKRNCVTVDD